MAAVLAGSKVGAGNRPGSDVSIDEMHIVTNRFVEGLQNAIARMLAGHGSQGVGEVLDKRENHQFADRLSRSATVGARIGEARELEVRTSKLPSNHLAEPAVRRWRRAAMDRFLTRGQLHRLLNAAGHAFWSAEPIDVSPPAETYLTVGLDADGALKPAYRDRYFACRRDADDNPAILTPRRSPSAGRWRQP